MAKILRHCVEGVDGLLHGGPGGVDAFELTDEVRCQRCIDVKGSEMWIYIRKRRLFNVDLHIGSSEPVGTVRLSMSIEDPVPPVDHKRSTVMVRMKKRKSMIYKRMVRYDFTITWQGKTPAEAAAAKPVFEIEIEMLDLSDIRKLLS